MKEWIILPEYQNHFLKRIKYRAVHINMVIWTLQKIEFSKRKIGQMENNQYGAQRRTFEIRDIKDMFKFLLIHDQNPRWRGERKMERRNAQRGNGQTLFKIDKNKTPSQPTELKLRGTEVLLQAKNKRKILKESRKKKSDCHNIQRTLTIQIIRK